MENSASLIGSDNQYIEYNAYGKISYIEEGDYEMEFTYGPDRERWKSVLTNDGNTVRTVIYAGDYERITENGVTRHYYYLDGGAVLVRRDNMPDSICYICDDHLGSVRKIITATGQRVFEATFDAWGRQTITKNDIGFLRGYTGHEMMPEYGLINMNGRLYDPILGRFLSPDNYVQLPDFSQSFNRYSYCLNNPLKYTDPSGELFGIDDMAIAFAIFNAASSMMQAAYNGQNIWKAGGLSLLSSAATYGIGQAFGSVGSFSHEILRAGAHGLASGTIGVLGGGSFLSGFASGALSSGIGSFAQGIRMDQNLMVLTTTAMGGLGAWATGGDILQGAMQGLTIGMLNHNLHDGGNDGQPVKVKVMANKTGTYEFIVIGTRIGGTGAGMALQGLLTIGSGAATFFEHNNYSRTFNHWRGKNGKLYSGLTGRGPNRYTGSRSLAMEKAMKFNRAGKLLGGVSTGISGLEFRNSLVNSGMTVETVEHGLDVIVGAAGFIPEAGPFISLYWGLGGKQLHNMWVNEVVLPQYKMGILGLPATMPFK